jgi:hypothetical protein
LGKTAGGQRTRGAGRSGRQKGRALYCLVKFVPVPHHAADARHAMTVENDRHERLVGNAVPLAFEALS